MAAESPLLLLPEEVIAHILSYVPDASLTSVFLVCHKFDRIAKSPLEMRKRCLQFKHWHHMHQIDCRNKHALSTSDRDWKTLFSRRMRVANKTSSLLDRIINEPTNRIARFNDIAEFEYDAMDMLAKSAEVGPEAEDVLARRWHATAAIHYIHRRRALHIWKQAFNDEDVPLEVALGAFDIFVSKTAEPDIDDMLIELDSLATQFRAAHPDFSSLSNSEKAICLIEWMQSQGFRGAPPERFRALKNVFIGTTMRSVRTAIPLTLVAIFCALSSRLGLPSHACAYPGQVLAIVESEASEYMYFDVFNEPKRLDLSRLESLVRDAGENVERVLQPASTRDMMLRAAENILATLQNPPFEREQQMRDYPPICEHSALYGSLMAIVVLRKDVTVNIVSHMTQQVPDEYPMDVKFLQEELLPKVGLTGPKSILKNVCNALWAEDEMAKSISRRDRIENKAILYYIGTVFRHRRYRYEGVIIGWTSTCRPHEGEDWIERMNIDGLARGRNQPFYHVLVADDSVRYVAEENINKIHLEHANHFSEQVGKYFRRFDEETGRFVSNIRLEFPDD